ncbi:MULTISPECIES: hypothetical protein [Pseudonocardia]|uniref:Uncharacterized protein n=2 Tax=Pseudonocardia TaxID=1847 RepID=A0A1Y2MJL5_PSEAH|nr:MULTISPECIES: hypothetical protein [Pseudonocardia]OSY35453.1 hypothetical protein BG845_06089 [Pseudonocardia autotrophica]TDN72204.1 hypothetical protein C8E95_1258 [Pseudonocardia autotrophica]BBG02911.1 hypothetical protein Pdca_41200 [Pseudonocardia autotrophica]GEC27625.1 hypothetical protein PSA01_46540 [Pseudonocardia saturnea]
MSGTLPHDTPVSLDVPAARRGGRFLLGSFLVFAAMIVVDLVRSTLDGSLAAERTAADQLGVDPNELPPEVVARIHGEPSLLDPMPYVLIAGATAFAVGVTVVARASGPTRRRPGAVAATAAVVCAVAWGAAQVVALLVRSAGMAVGNVLPVLVTVTCAAGGVALVALVVALRPSGVARRTGTVVAGLGVVTVAACFTLPPLVPFALGAVLGVPLAATRRSRTL